jgi:hypothetical protein
MTKEKGVAMMSPENGRKMLLLEERINGEMLRGLRPSDWDKFINLKGIRL